MKTDERTIRRCPDEEVIVEYAQGRLSSEQRASIEAHVDGCPACADVVTGMVRIFGTSAPLVIGSEEDVEATYADDGDVAPADAPLPAGTAIGRYRLLEWIGAGGMGVVYAAYDPELDRRVAIKVLRTREGPQRDARNHRLLREAQALARLSHPNVIAVHDVGTFADQVFVAMEFVNGENLTQWLRVRLRTWPEIRDVFVAAGRGLAAAHAVGLVHRDFKPDNVLVGRDGRVRVTDFGLARIAGQLGTESISGEGGRLEESTGKIPVVTLTATGALLGTPAYMAPEQFAGRRIDATSDQYSFCVALYEAVVGERPFSAKNVTQLATSVLEQDPVVPTSARAPAAVRRAILRGLSRSRAGRFPDMHALLVVLERDRAKLRRFALAGIGLAAISTALGVGLGHGSTDPRPSRCLGAPPVPGWNDDAIAAIGARFDASGVAFAAPSWSALREGLEERVTSLRRVHEAACAAWNDPEVDDEFAVRRFECLDDRGRELAAVFEVLAEADAGLVRDAARIPETIEDAASCDDAEALGRERLPPPDPRMLSRIDEARGELERASALEFAGRYEDALSHTATALAEADLMDYGPLRAEVLARRGMLLDRVSRSADAVETLYDAAATATANRHHAAAARAWIELVYALGRHEHRFGEARVAAKQAEAELVALGGDDNLEAARLTNVGTLEFDEGRVDEALVHYRLALALRERLNQPLRQADVLFNIANVELMQGVYDRAETHLRECLALWQAVVGTAHPDTLDVIHSLGVLHGHAGRPDAAREQLELALRLRTELLGADSREAASSASALGRAYVDLGRVDEGVALMERALAVYERLHGVDHLQVAGQRAHMAEALWAAGRRIEARRELERAIAIETAALGEDHPTVASSMRTLAHFDLAEGHRTKAEKTLKRSLATLEKAWGPDNLDVVATREMLAAAARGEAFE